MMMVVMAVVRVEVAKEKKVDSKKNCNQILERQEELKGIISHIFCNLDLIIC